MLIATQAYHGYNTLWVPIARRCFIVQHNRQCIAVLRNVFCCGRYIMSLKGLIVAYRLQPAIVVFKLIVYIVPRQSRVPCMEGLRP